MSDLDARWLLPAAAAGSAAAATLLAFRLLPGRDRPGTAPARRAIPWEAWLGARRRRRLLLEQFPAFLERLSATLRAGTGIEQALERCALEAREPLRGELSRAVQAVKVGRDLRAALPELAARLAIPDAALAASAIGLAIETGGSLGDALDAIAATVRERRRVEGKLAALTAQGRMQAWVIGLLPVALGIFLWSWDPASLRWFMETPTGRLSLAAAVALEAVGVLWILRIVRPDA